MTKTWDIGKRSLVIGRRPLVMGILNVTPDSFSDGGRYSEHDQAFEAALQMQSDGADLIDIGGESTRPYSHPVSLQEELGRVVPLIASLAAELAIPISIDTSKSQVASAAMEAGAEILNDVTGLEGDSEMLSVVQASDVGICVMHMQGNPQTMQDDPTYGDVVQEIRRYLVARRDFCRDAGIAEDRICLDPGIGFGKTPTHNLELIRNLDQFTDLGCPLLVGHSRKGFIAKVLGDKNADRTAATLGVSLALAAAGANVLRVHDVKPTVDALRLFEAFGGLK